MIISLPCFSVLSPFKKALSHSGKHWCTYMCREFNRRTQPFQQRLVCWAEQSRKLTEPQGTGTKQISTSFIYSSFWSLILMHSGFLCAVAAAALCKVGSLRRSNQPNLKTKTMISQRLLLFIPHPGCSCHILKSFERLNRRTITT